MGESVTGPASTYDVHVENDVIVPMRDGVQLATNILRPVGGSQPLEARLPVLLQRTPYNKSSESRMAEASFFASQGYVSVIQDCRGRYASQGGFSKYVDEGNDGYDTIEWAATLEWSDGRVGTWGHSNASWAIWMMLASQPPSLSSTLASGISQNILDINFGIFETGRRLEWTHMMAADIRRRAELTDGAITPAQASKRWNEVERVK